MKNGKKNPKLKVHKHSKRSQVLQQLSARTLGCVSGPVKAQTGSAVGFGAYTWFTFQSFEVYCAMLLLLLLESILQVFYFFLFDEDVNPWRFSACQTQLRLEFGFGHLIDIQINLQVLF